MQRVLHKICEEYFASKEHLIVNYDDLLANPLENTRRTAEYLELDSSEENPQKASSAIRS